MSIVDMLFGAGAQQALTGISNQSNSQMSNNALANQYNHAQSQAFQQSMNNWNTNPFAKTSQWVFAGNPCTIQEFADCIWGAEEHPDKMLFLLTHSGPEKK